MSYVGINTAKANGEFSGKKKETYQSKSCKILAKIKIKIENFWNANSTAQNTDLLVEDFGFSVHLRCTKYIALYWSKSPFHTVLESKHDHKVPP